MRAFAGGGCRSVFSFIANARSTGFQTRNTLPMAEIIEMPKLSDTMTVGTLVKWLKAEGDKVAVGDMLCEVETDKATMEVENFFAGVLLKQYVPVGGQIPVGAAMCAIGQAGETAPAAPAPSAPKAVEKKTEPRQETSVGAVKGPGTPEDHPAEPPPSPDLPAPKLPAEAQPVREPEPVPAPEGEGAEGGRVKASPLARRVAAEKGVSLAGLKGSGPGGRIVKADILAAAERPAPAPTPARPQAPVPSPVAAAPAQDQVLPVSNMRGVIARRLLESKTTIPHFYLEMEVDAEPLHALRASLNARLGELPPERGGIKFTINDFILKATAEALRRVPSVNASWQGQSILQHAGVHVAFGVAIDDGLVTPVIRNAHQKGLRQIAEDAKALIGKARSRKLKPEEMTGSTFTVTNLGMYGVNAFYGIINPPNAAILSVGATVKKPVVDAQDRLVVGQRMMLALSCDHRVVDGAAGAQFLAALRELLESPALMLV